MKPLPRRLSLAELHRKAGLNRTGADIDEGARPTLRDLTETLLFSPGDGRIWLNDQRMVLLRSSTYGAIRSELIACIGQDLARALLTRVGYSAGARDAELVRRAWPDSDPANAYHAGPRMHKVTGFVRPETVHLEFDIERGDFLAEYRWNDSTEDEEHLATYGIGTEPACWMQIGYASGYASSFMGKMILFRETACQSMGAPACQITGRPADQWDDADEDLRYFALEASAQRVRRTVVPAFSEVGRIRDDADALAAQAPEALIGISAAFSTARHLIERVAPTQATVLFTGATGVGKELFSRTLHQISPRRDAPFIALNCAAVPDTLIESELFGVERGAYTGATTARAGRFERAHGGTLFLDEIASLSEVAQGKLLRALQERVVERVGGTRPIAVNVRVVAASNRDLREEVLAGRFREDLFFRLNVFPIQLPPLKERRDDIPLLMESFLRRYRQLHGRDVSGFTPRAVRALLQYDFPGNIRELQNLVERGVIMVEDGEPIDIQHLFRSGELQATALVLQPGGRLADPAWATSPTAQAPVAAVGQSAAERQGWGPDAQRYRQALADARFNVAEAARALGLSRAQLAYRLKKLGAL
jgi:two-component system response regulator HydG